MCGALDDIQLQHLSAQASRARVSPGEALITQTDEVNAYATVIRGVVKLVRILEDGRQQIVGLQFAPDLVGRLFSGESEILAEAATEVEVCRIPRPALERMIHEAPDLQHRLFEQSQRELTEARDWMVTLGRKTAAEKVASFLYLIATHHDPDAPDAKPGQAAFSLRLPWLDPGNRLPADIETAPRQCDRTAFAPRGLRTRSRPAGCALRMSKACRPGACSGQVAAISGFRAKRCRSARQARAR